MQHNTTRRAVYCLAIIPLALVATVSADERPAKPNILWIVTEDIGCDMACYGTKGVHTPNLGQLAAEGTLYTRSRSGEKSYYLFIERKRSKQKE